MSLAHYYRSYGRRKLKSSSSFSFKGKWFNDDLNRGGEGRVKTFVKGLNSSDDGAMYFGKQAYNALIAYGIPTDAFTATSTLPQPYRASSGGKTVLLPNEVRISMIGDTRSRYCNDKWELQTYDIDDLPKFYMVKNSTYDYSYNIKNDLLKESINNNHSLKGILEALGYGKSDICMVSAKNEQVMIDNCLLYTSDAADE